VTSIRLFATDAEYDIPATVGEPILLALRTQGLPANAFILFAENGQILSVTDAVPESGVHALALRNPDFSILGPALDVIRRPGAVAERFAVLGEHARATLVQYTRQEALDFAYSSVAPVLDEIYRRTQNPQIALSSGGDGRALAELARRWLDEHGRPPLHAVITSTGFENPDDHISSGLRIAEQFGLDATVVDEDRAAELLGYRRTLSEIATDFSTRFPYDELEVLGTYWVQEVNLAVAAAEGRTSILFGYNAEDVIADRLYQLLGESPLPAYPLRYIADRQMTLAAPLHKVPKRMIDVLDIENSRRNYGNRVPSGSYLRSSLYFAAYMILERFPPLADALVGSVDSPVRADDSASLREWLLEQ
jgi:hypothetical protein